MENPNFYAIIPANVRYADITPNAKLLYGEITALCNKTGCCYASNQYFADLYNVSKKSISKWIKELQDNGFVSSELIYKDGSKEIVNRYVRIIPEPMEEKFHTPMEEKFKDNNTNNNITFNNIYTQQFEEFWKEYTPVKCDGRFVAKGSREDAEKRFIKILKDGEKYEDIINGCRQYIEYCKRNNQLTCGVAVFLNQERWKNDYSGSSCESANSNERPKPRSYLEIYSEIAAELAEKDNIR